MADPRDRRLLWLVGVLLASVAVLTLDRADVIRVFPEDAPSPSTSASGDLPPIGGSTGEAPPPALADLPLHTLSTTPPTGPAGARTQWVIDRLNLFASTLDADDIEAQFAPSVVEAIGAEPLVDEFKALAAAHAPVALVGWAEPPTTDTLAGVVAVSGGGFRRIDVQVEAEEPHRLTTFVVSPFPSLTRP